MSLFARLDWPWPASGSSSGLVVHWVLSAWLAYTVWTWTYNVLFHPLRRFPGPKLHAMAWLPFARMELSGTIHRQLLSLHVQYGDVVRVAPDTLSYSHPKVMKEVRGHRKASETEHQKDLARVGDLTKSVFGADRPNHARYRRSLTKGFSFQSMLGQQFILKRHTDRLMQQLEERGGRGTRALNIMVWFNYVTFDIIGDLAFGEPFGCLEQGRYDMWVSLIVKGLKVAAFLATFKRLLPTVPFPTRLARLARLNRYTSRIESRVRQKLQKRLDANIDRPDFVDSMKAEHGSRALDFDEMLANSVVLTSAGSETSSTALTAATYYLGLHPDVLARLVAEIRTKFATEDAIDLVASQNLTYLQAVLNEAMRLCPPAPAGQPRIIGKGGATVLGKHVPEGTHVDVSQWALYKNPSHFRRPSEFLPQRWLGDPEFADDQREAFQPFSVGPRNCVGQNLANAEICLILTWLLWKFDVVLAENSYEWMEENKVYLTWEKAPLYVFLKPRTES